MVLVIRASYIARTQRCATFDCASDRAQNQSDCEVTIVDPQGEAILGNNVADGVVVCEINLQFARLLPFSLE